MELVKGHEHESFEDAYLVSVALQHTTWFGDVSEERLGAGVLEGVRIICGV